MDHDNFERAIKIKAEMKEVDEIMRVLISPERELAVCMAGRRNPLLRSDPWDYIYILDEKARSILLSYYDAKYTALQQKFDEL